MKPSQTDSRGDQGQSDCPNILEDLPAFLQLRTSIFQESSLTLARGGLRGHSHDVFVIELVDHDGGGNILQPTNYVTLDYLGDDVGNESLLVELHQIMSVASVKLSMNVPQLIVECNQTQEK
jgi:hypothetical protein